MERCILLNQNLFVNESVKKIFSNDQYDVSASSKFVTHEEKAMLHYPNPPGCATPLEQRGLRNKHCQPK